MKLVGIFSTAVLSLTLGAIAPAYAQQEQQKQQEEQKAKQQGKNAREEKTAQQQHTQEAKPAVQAQHSNANHGGRIPDERFKANFGREHSFRVSQGDYRDRHFQ